jgi:hypothetical protein
MRIIPIRKYSIATEYSIPTYECYDLKELLCLFELHNIPVRKGVYNNSNHFEVGFASLEVWESFIESCKTLDLPYNIIFEGN